MNSIEIEYHFVRQWIENDSVKEAHARVLDLLEQVQSKGMISGYRLYERGQALPASDSDQSLLASLRSFAMRRKIRPVVGSNKHPYGWFPAQLILVFEEARMIGVFPCDLEGSRVEPLAFLETILTGGAWTLLARKKAQGNKKHARLAQLILGDPSQLEPELTLLDCESFVSGDSLEAGRIDFVFRDRAGRYLLVEIKVKADEIKTGIGQLMIQRELFVELNRIPHDQVRLGLACPDILPAARKACIRIGIACFDLSSEAIRDADASA
jgi:hypothetical protein